MYNLAKDDLNGYLKKTSHSARLKALGIEKDIEFCLKVDRNYRHTCFGWGAVGEGGVNGMAP
jgi:hypothetical protein